jgi:hypothetical protein
MLRAQKRFPPFRAVFGFQKESKMHKGIPFALLIPLTALMIPIIAIILSYLQKMYEMRLKYGRSSANVPNDEMAAMKKRMEEMEARILTLQDLVIGGDYEIRKRLGEALHASTEKGETANPNVQPPIQRVSGP